MSEELWKAANEEIDKRKKPVGNQEKTARCFGVNPGKHVFSGKLVCGLCGAPFTGQQEREKIIKFMNGNENLSGTGEKKEEKPGGCSQYPSGRGKVVSLLLKGPRKKKSCQIRKGDYGFFHAAFEGKSGRKPKEEFGKVRTAGKKIKYQQQLLLDKYLEGLVEESLYQIKERELQK